MKFQTALRIRTLIHLLRSLQMNFPNQAMNPLDTQTLNIPMQIKQEEWQGIIQISVQILQNLLRQVQGILKILQKVQMRNQMISNQETLRFQAISDVFSVDNYTIPAYKAGIYTKGNTVQAVCFA